MPEPAVPPPPRRAPRSGPLSRTIAGSARSRAPDTAGRSALRIRSARIAGETRSSRARRLGGRRHAEQMMAILQRDQAGLERGAACPPPRRRSAASTAAGEPRSGAKTGSRRTRPGRRRSGRETGSRTPPGRRRHPASTNQGRRLRMWDAPATDRQRAGPRRSAGSGSRVPRASPRRPEIYRRRSRWFPSTAPPAAISRQPLRKRRRRPTNRCRRTGTARRRRRNANTKPPPRSRNGGPA